MRERHGSRQFGGNPPFVPGGDTLLNRDVPGEIIARLLTLRMLNGGEKILCCTLSLID